MMKNSWLNFFLGCAAILVFIILLHFGSVHLGGTTGQLIKENREKDLEVYAYVYSEVSDLEDFLDDESGRYGRASLVNSIKEETCGNDVPLAAAESW